MRNGMTVPARLPRGCVKKWLSRRGFTNRKSPGVRDGRGFRGGQGLFPVQPDRFGFARRRLDGDQVEALAECRAVCTTVL